jgi:hypothetical protein
MEGATCLREACESDTSCWTNRRPGYPCARRRRGVPSSPRRRAGGRVFARKPAGSSPRAAPPRHALSRIAFGHGPPQVVGDGPLDRLDNAPLALDGDVHPPLERRGPLGGRLGEQLAPAAILRSGQVVGPAPLLGCLCGYSRWAPPSAAYRTHASRGPRFSAWARGSRAAGRSASRPLRSESSGSRLRGARSATSRSHAPRSAPWPPRSGSGRPC